MLGDMKNVMRTLLMPMVGAIALAATLAGPAAASDTVWYRSPTRPINHWANDGYNYYCPPGYVIGDSSNPLGIPFTSNSSAGVSSSLMGGGYGSTYINVGFVNWNWWGNQTIGITYACHPMPIPGLH